MPAYRLYGLPEDDARPGRLLPWVETMASLPGDIPERAGAFRCSPLREALPTGCSTSASTRWVAKHAVRTTDPALVTSLTSIMPR